ncbi:MAG: phosphodiesterase [Clostridiales bacterium]|uniref:phosphodiesterase n=1 Tax=Provencibacterium massiliense TaxID=1841868 RepID=UPI0009A5FA3B|nr:phosphodiesterase [Provencibacterium massiliense]PWM40551.1 MAG: phosphodiesterase [Clostridiales bacterium]RGB67876.1 phosphodiesterase [Harryflintia acetispora]
MKLMIASDIHGSRPCCEALLGRYEKERAGRLVLLGDLLYHGPRNDLPEGYDPKGVIRLLNDRRQELFCVRGNCDAEVDQMVLQFPILADYALLWLEGRTVFATHGHIYNEQSLPPLKEGDVLLHGHTHVLAAREMGSHIYLNPGSVSLPKEGNPRSYMTYEDGVFTIKDLEGGELCSLSIR